MPASASGGASGSIGGIRALPVVPIDADVIGLIDKAGVAGLMPAVAAVEQVKEINKEVVSTIGFGLDGFVWFDAHDAADKKKWIVNYMGAMIRADAKGVSAWAKDRGWTTATDRAMQIGRSTRRFVDLLSEERSSGGDAGARKTPKITVVADAEDGSYTSDEFDGTELAKQQKMAWIMYRREFIPGLVVKIKVMMKMKYSIAVEMQLPSIERVSLKDLRMKPSDTSITLLERWIIGVFLVCAGAGVPPGMESNGFGNVDGNGTFPTQYLSWHDCQPLLDTYKVAISAVDESVAVSILESLITTMAAKSGAGHPRLTASAVFGMTVHEVNGCINAAVVGANAAAIVIEQRAAKRAKLEDDVVPNTPNKLPRMKGGNPDGKLCKDFMKGKCKGATCSFSHEKPPTTTPDDD